MKYIILVGDGMADHPLKEFSGKTPLQIARTPNMDWIASNGILGTVHTIPEGCEPGSDVANLSILGLDPEKDYPGRGPLEAASMGLQIQSDEVVFRCNLVTINNGVMADYSAGHIKTQEAEKLIAALNQGLGFKSEKFYNGLSYRHLCVIKTSGKKELEGLRNVRCAPPHNITGKNIKPHLPRGKFAQRIKDVMHNASIILEKHDINRVRIDLKENPANAVWLWGQGVDIRLPSFKDRFGIAGAMISEVDLVKGIGKMTGLDIVNVEGATGYYDTNYKGIADAGINVLKDYDFAFIHIEAPDEASHNGDLREKINAIERFDSLIVGCFVEYIKKNVARLLVLPDHATPVSKRTHTSEPVCFAIVGAGINTSNPGLCFNEQDAAKTGYNIEKGYSLIERFMEGI